MANILNKKQKEAVDHKKGPLLIIAGAGTGKTTVITERIKHLIVEKNIPASSLLALTFTEKAAFEMQERIDVLLPYGYTNLWIHTFHSFCDRVLRDEAHNIGLDPNYKLISEAESVLLLRQHIFDLGLKLYRPLGNPTKFLDALLTHFSRLKDEDVTPQQYFDWVKKQRDKDKVDEELRQYQELAEAFKEYEKLKVKEGIMDFSDLISNTLLLFRQRKSILETYQKQFKYILVDEFQDTNYSQNELAILLAGDDKNITVVADDDQSIYRFRGAAVSNVIQFKKSFPKAKIITLIENYRSTQIILDRAYNLIQNNNPNRLEVVEKISKKLKSNSGSSSKDIELIHETRPEDEADAIALKIKELTRKKYSFKDVGILVRANNHSQAIQAALSRYRIPYQFLGPGYLFQQSEIKDLIAYLTFLTNLSDTVSLFRVLSMDIFDISYIELNYILNFAKKKNLTLFEALEYIEEIPIKAQTKEKIYSFKKMVEKHISRIKKDTAGQILYYFLVDTKLFEAFAKVESVKDEKRVQNISKFFEKIKNFESERSDNNIFTLVEWLTLMIQMGDSPLAAEIDVRDLNAVNILTVHSSKGLEFPVVFMINLVNDRFPSRERSEKIPLPQALLKEKVDQNIDFHLAEERRLFYVGMTRAKNILFFSAADYYGMGKRPKKISPFVFEALPDLMIPKKQDVQQLELSDILSTYAQETEVKEEKSPYKLSYITYSNLQMFDICPLHFKAKVIFNIPTPTAAVQSFGISLHNTLYRFYMLVQDGTFPTRDDLQDILEKEWLSDGYENKKHEEERFAQGTKILDEFYSSEGKNPLKPLALELPVSFILNTGVKVFGKIDRVDKKGRGIEIIDYKTGENNPKAEKSHKLQLAMYALAATKIKDPVLDRKPEDITVSIQFLEGNTKKSMSFSSGDLEKLEDELIERITEIEKSDFKCSRSILCANCEYKILCSTN